jgi:hypothetical protein
MYELFAFVEPRTAGFLPVESGVTPLESMVSNDHEATTLFGAAVGEGFAAGGLPKFVVSYGVMSGWLSTLLEVTK